MNKDIEFLYNLVNKKSQKYNNFVKKNIINRELHAKYDLYLPITNQNGNYKYNNNQFNYTYNYQRYDGFLSYNNFVKNFYRINSVHSKTFFTNCGMASIFAVLTSFSLVGKYNISFANDIYFETQKIIKNLSGFKNRRKKIYYLDTISDSFTFDCNIKNAIIIIDTTCYSSNSFKQMIKKMLNNNCFCILVRSHTKLDMLGLEYSSLGSIVYLLPERLKQQKIIEYKKIIEKSMEILSCLGMFAQERNIFPLLNDLSMIELNQQRIKRIQYNNEYFYKSTNNRFHLHNHKLFLTTNNFNNYSIDFLKSKIIEFTTNNSDICMFSGSFGFDYIAIDTFMDLIEKKNVIRISIGDVDKKEIDIFLEKINELLEGLQNDKI